MQSHRFLIVLKLCTLAAVVGVLLAVAGQDPEPVEGAFPGANGKIAFSSWRDGNWEIYVMNADGSGQTNLTNNPADDMEPVWSPDGTKIAFQSNRDEPNPLTCSPCNFEIYVMNADGSGQTRLTDSPLGDGHPAWSPDGSQIAFGSERDGDGEIYVMNADGTGETNLTNNPAGDADPAWSPDGSRIAFITERDGQVEIYAMNADGTGQTNLTNDPAWDVIPDWSPDASKIAFTSDRGGQDEIYVMNADGSGQTRLIADNPGPPTEAVWSPDGSKIAFIRNADIYVANADGSGNTNLTNNPAMDGWLDWQPLAPFELADTDGDGCTDKAEYRTKSEAATGGGRDPKNRWDFYDVAGVSGPDGFIDLGFDILGVILHYAPGGYPVGQEAEYATFDRGPSVGPNSWNMTAPDGVIDLGNDILGAILQYAHDCR